MKNCDFRLFFRISQYNYYIGILESLVADLEFQQITAPSCDLCICLYFFIYNSTRTSMLLYLSNIKNIRIIQTLIIRNI